MTSTFTRIQHWSRAATTFMVSPDDCAGDRPFTRRNIPVLPCLIKARPSGRTYSSAFTECRPPASHRLLGIVLNQLRFPAMFVVRVALILFAPTSVDRFSLRAKLPLKEKCVNRFFLVDVVREEVRARKLLRTTHAPRKQFDASRPLIFWMNGTAGKSTATDVEHTAVRSLGDRFAQASRLRTPYRHLNFFGARR